MIYKKYLLLGVSLCMLNACNESKSVSLELSLIHIYDDIVTRDVPAYLFTSWAKGNYEFRHTSLSEIVAQLSRWYNVDIYFRCV